MFSSMALSMISLTLVLAGLMATAEAGEASANGTQQGTEAQQQLPQVANMSHIATQPTLKGQAAVAMGGYSSANALMYAYLATASYCGDRLNNWDCGTACTEEPGMEDVRQIDDASLGAHSFVGKLRGQCVLAFRGTDSPNGWMQDFASFTMVPLPGCSHRGEACRVGQGYRSNYEALAGRIKESLKAIGCGPTAPLALTGHSLGAAMVTLALLDLRGEGWAIKEAYTFGSPYVGDRSFAEAFNERLRGVRVFRVTRADDPIVYQPAASTSWGLYYHVGTEVFYRGAASEGFTVCDGSGNDPQGAGRVPRYSSFAAIVAACSLPETYPSLCGHLRYMQTEMKCFMYRTSCSGGPRYFWP